ncbi:hypothetical protein POKO110462_19710 [Pontibacter korlensis]|uniref:hypothetical protein n=1 Tax=Pontibacter korlensis TaxID=400092 RepID=UPI000A3F6459|nr:hypothetical protein [Pontibacter korlensis]
MRTASDKEQFERLLASAREKTAKDRESESKQINSKASVQPKRLLHNIGHPWDHITGDY